MSIEIIAKDQQAYGAFNNGEIVENKPIGFPREGGPTKPYSNLFYWANAIARVDSTIGLHPHQGFEIMSFVLEGSIRHYDTQLKAWKDLSKGDVQIIRAGKGISHAEHMNEGSRMFQIWVDPDLNKTMQQHASYNDYKADEIPKTEHGDIEILHYAGDKGVMQLNAPNVMIQRWKLEGTHKIEDTDQIHSIYVLTNEVVVNGKRAVKDDFILADGESLTFTGSCELFVIGSARKLDYKTYVEMM